MVLGYIRGYVLLVGTILQRLQGQYNAALNAAIPLKLENNMSVQITCATDDELRRMISHSTYTEYYISLIQAEITKRKTGDK